MNWNCPHCGIELSIAEEAVGAEWKLTRCHACNGFSLIKATAEEPVLIDSPPAHQPEPPAFRHALRAEPATPVEIVDDSPFSSAAVASLSRAREKLLNARAQSARHKAQVQAPAPNTDQQLPVVAQAVSVEARIPEPLPDEPKRPLLQRLLHKISGDT